MLLSHKISKEECQVLYFLGMLLPGSCTHTTRNCETRCVLVVELKRPVINWHRISFKKLIGELTHSSYYIHHLWLCQKSGWICMSWIVQWSLETGCWLLNRESAQFKRRLNSFPYRCTISTKNMLAFYLFFIYSTYIFHSGAFNEVFIMLVIFVSLSLWIRYLFLSTNYIFLFSFPVLHLYYSPNNMELHG